MNKSQSIIILIFIVITVFTVIVSTSLEIEAGNTACSNKIIESIVPWDAGCFYTAFFEENSTDDRLIFEQSKLKEFTSKRGVNSEILWYRLKFHQKYQNKFRSSFEDIHNMYLDYIKSEHFQIIRHVDYLGFLRDMDLIPLSQTTLNHYCDTYIRDKRKDLALELKRLITKYNIPVSTAHCMDRNWIKSKYTPNL